MKNVAIGFGMVLASGSVWLAAICAWRLDHGATLAGFGLALFVVVGESMGARNEYP